MDATPADRDRVVDVARGLSIVVVALWHWTLSVTFRAPDGALVMGNPIHVVPGGRLATWVLQVMPVFFLAGGYVNLLGWQRARAGGGSAGGFVAGRLSRLARPTGLWLLAWLGAELVAAALPGDHRWVWQWFPGYLTPLWFLAVYGVLVALVPLTATWHLRHPNALIGSLLVLIVAGSVLHRGLGWAWAAWVTAAAVWLFCHQLGYAWRSWDEGHRPLGRRVALAAAGLVALIGLTTYGGYPSSMVATAAGEESNLFPTNATIAALAVFQLGLLALATPALERALRRRRAWKPVVAVNAVAMTIFVWHMTALLVVIWGYERLGGVLPDEPNAQWWAQRWLWLVAPAAVLVVLLALFGRFELPRSRPERR